jgi:gliding motility-associated-like protein
LPVLNVTADKNPICEGETVKLTANSNIPSTTYLWSNTSTASFINVSPLSSSYYFVTGTASNCHDTAGINIAVISKQSIDLGEDRYLCVGDEVNLTANNLTGTYLWSNGNSSNTVTLTEPGVYWLRVDNNGCIASDTIEMKKCSEIWVPNVFTPNGDGTNEIFKPVTTEIQKLTMFIYNRWGEMIFETSDINGGWDGKFHGNEVPTGVYFWVIRYNENRSSAQNIEKEIKGSVTVLR